MPTARSPGPDRSRAIGAPAPWEREPPLVGRRADSTALRLRLDDALEGRGSVALLTGEPGSGKSRLLAELRAEAAARQMPVGQARGYGVEAALPYGTISDLLAEPVLALAPAVITLLSRGTEHELRRILPLQGGPPSVGPRDEGEGTTRLYWVLAQFVRRLAERRPLLLLVDDAHRADPSSLECLHFLARHLTDAPLLLVLAFAEPPVTPDARVDAIRRSLEALPGVHRHPLDLLSEADVVEWLERTFGLRHDEAAPPAALLHAHTGGNPLFLHALLERLGEGGHIRALADGWQLRDPASATLPASVRDVLAPRVDALPPAAERLVELAAVSDGLAPLALLRDATGLDAHAFADVVERLTARRVLEEQHEGGIARLPFVHPLLRRLAQERLSTARAQAAHAALAAALLRRHGDADPAHAHAIAHHLARADTVGSDALTLRQLALAGQTALDRRADADAVRWLEEGVRLATRLGETAQALTLAESLGVAWQRRGDSAAALAAWQQALALLEERPPDATQARLLFRIGQESARAGNGAEALTVLAKSHAIAVAHDDHALRVAVRVAEAKTRQAIGDHPGALAAAHDALHVADATHAPALRARAHQTLLQLLAWTGPVGDARAHGRRALALAASAGDREAEWTAHWALGMLEGFTAHAGGVARHYREALALAEQLASPLLEAMSAELAIEHASCTGRWDEALVLSTRVLPMARAMAPQSLLPRLLVWTGLVVLERARWEDARALFDDAWRLTHSDEPAEQPAFEPGASNNVHNRILAHLGLGAYALARGAYTQASTYGEQGLALADRHGYVAWALHRLLPLVIEADLWLQRYERVRTRAARLRADATAFDHRLGVAWADAADGFVRRLRDQDPGGTQALLQAADALDAVPFVLHAARLRRHAAPLLAADGDPDGAVRALRAAHETFARLGAERELRETRSLLRSFGVRLPPRVVAQGSAALTTRELEIAHAVADHRSNKEIGARLGISSRTVSTHLSNIFHKLGVASRGALAARVREDPSLRRP